MTATRTLRFVWSTWLLSGLALAAAASLAVSHGGALWWILVWGMPASGASIVGGMLCLRVSSNPLGWLFLGLGVTLGFGLAGDAYAAPALGLPGSEAVGAVANLFEELLWIWVPLVLLLFPGGELPSRRWRPVGVLVGASAVALAATILTSPGQVSGFSNGLRFNNPLALSGSTGLVLAVPGEIGFVALVIVTTALVGSLAMRFRQATGDQRQQLKWFASAAALLAAAVLSGPVGLWSVWSGNVWVFLWALATTALVVAMGVAILRYRLYEIDVIIRRTIVYASLVGSLVLIYLGGVYFVDRALQAVTGQSSALAVTVSTLAVAAVFQPLRTRIQSGVDHRFYRGKYDAAQTLEAFSGRLRDQIDLDTLSADVLTVINLTLRPSHASLWLRPTIPDTRLGDGARTQQAAQATSTPTR